MSNFPKRGEIWLVNWNPARGSEQAGKRPALVIQNDIGNEKAPTTIVAAISSKVKWECIKDKDLSRPVIRLILPNESLIH